MISVRRSPCQTLRAGAAVGLILWRVNAPAAPGNEASPSPPAWQQEVTAARLLEGSLVLSPPANSAEAEDRRRRLAELYEHLARAYPAEAEVQRAAADHFTREGRADIALPYWEQAARLDPRDAETADRLGGELLRMGRTREAYARFQQAVAAQPASASYHFDLANVLYLFRRDLVSPPLTGLPDEQAALTLALAHFQRAAQLAPADLRLAQAYAETFYVFARPDWTQALLAWEAVLALSGEKGDFANSHLARISLRQGKPEVATAYLARMHDPAFDELKAKLQRQADRLPPAPHP